MPTPQPRKAPWSALAEEAVEKKLRIADFLSGHGPNIYERFEEFERKVKTSQAAQPETVQDLTFIALCLPVVSGLIHVATTKADFDEALSWVASQSPQIDGTAMLSALTFLYIVQEGEKALEGDPEKRELWAEIRKRVERFLEPGTTSQAGVA